MRTTSGYFLLLTSLAWCEPRWKVLQPVFPLVAPAGNRIEVEVQGPPGAAPILRCASQQQTLEEVRPGLYRGRFGVENGGLTIGEEVVGECVADARLGVFEVGEAGAVFRTGPSSDYDRQTPLGAGVRLEILQRQGDYFKVAPPLGWVKRSEGRQLPPEAGLGLPQLSSVQVGKRQLRLKLGVPCAWQLQQHPVRRALTLELPGVPMAMFQMGFAPESKAMFRDVQLQPYEGGTRVDISLHQRVWGHRLQWTGEDLVLDVSPAPRLHPRRPLQGLTVAIDPGHGGEDKGTVGLGQGVMEKDLNLRCSLALAEELRRAGARVVLTRDGDRQVAGDDASAAQELEARVQVAERARAQLFLSVHHNARADVSQGRISHGTDIYYFQPASAALAQSLAEPLAQAMGETSWRHLWRSFAVIRQTSMPAVLLEYNYLSNPQLESGMLARPDYPTRTARAVRQGLEKFLRSGL